LALSFFSFSLSPNLGNGERDHCLSISSVALGQILMLELSGEVRCYWWR
jgi:hypothetical protein